MHSFFKIWSIARYEAITLLRGWFFRIFSGLAITIFIFIDVIFFSKAVANPLLFKSLSCSIPYATMMILNIAQVAVIMLLATDFFKRDKRYNTTDVIYIRSMTNGLYLGAKALGVLLVFGLLDIFILLIGLIVHLIFSDISFNWQSYLLYPLLLAFPSFIFMLGLSFFLMRLIKNQAVVVLILLGYFAAELFYLNDKVYYIFDYLAMRIPLAYSDFVGIVNLNIYLLQRLMYVLLGIMFLLLTVVFFQRLPQSLVLKRIVWSTISLLLILSVISAATYLRLHEFDQEHRENMIALKSTLKTKAMVTPQAYSIEVNHLGDALEASAKIKFINMSDQPLMHLNFSINPGLKVKRVENADRELDFGQNEYLLQIDFDKTIDPGHSDTVIIHYGGRIDENICYLDINESRRADEFAVWLFQIRRSFAFLSKNFVLLSPECVWYPVPGLPKAVQYPEKSKNQFINFDLTVRTSEKLTAISQGNPDSISQGVTVFRPEFPLTEISLIIGPYQQNTLEVASTSIHLFRLGKHDYYMKYFNEIADTLSHIVKEAKQDYEVKLGLDYPFKRLALIEVPIQYYVYPRMWQVGTDVVHPEQIWLPENATLLGYANFKRMEENAQERTERSNQTFTKRESQANMLKQFIRYSFLGERPRFSGFGGPTPDYQPQFDIFPLFYSFSTSVNSDEWPLFNTALESYLFDRVNGGTPMSFFSNTEGLTKAEQVSQALQNKSLDELLISEEENELLTDIIRSKGAFLFKHIKIDQNQDLFESRLNELISKNRFRTLSFAQFSNALFGQGSIKSLHDYLTQWYFSKNLPAFLFSKSQMYKVMDGDRLRYQVLLQVSNKEAVDGLIEIQFQFGRFGGGRGGGGGRGFRGPAEESDPPRLYRLSAGQSKEIGIVLDAEPRAILIEALIARNLPLTHRKRFEKAEENNKRQLFEGERLIEFKDEKNIAQEIIVDNEHEDFYIYNPPFNSYLKRIIFSDKEENTREFDRFRWWQPPNQWRLLKSDSFFGQFIHSAYYIRPGDGKKKAVWKANIPEEGLYDIYSYQFDRDNFWRGRGRDRYRLFGEQTYTIEHEAGSDQVTVDAENSPAGWNFLGSYYFVRGETQVSLSDKSNSKIVIADAVKWVKN